jgi:poly(3-hydroxyalkanoate) synthetase
VKGFYTRQFVDALSPSNFVATNPEVFTATLESGGQNLLRGLENLLVDLERGNGRLSITMILDRLPEAKPGRVGRIMMLDLGDGSNFRRSGWPSRFCDSAARASRL